MKYYEQLIDKRVFGYPALAEIISENQNTIYSLIRVYLQKHYVEQVKKGLYVAVSVETGAPVASRFEIGIHILEQGYISHHSAFEYLGFTNQMMHTVRYREADGSAHFPLMGISISAFRSGLSRACFRKKTE